MPAPNPRRARISASKAGRPHQTRALPLDSSNPGDELLTRMARATRDNGSNGALSWEDIGFLAHGLAFASRSLSKATAAVTDRHSLGPRGAWILNLVSAGLVYPHELADMFQIGRSLISAELARLNEAGLTASKPGKDRRRTELALTNAGQEALNQIRGDLDATVRARLADYTPDEIRLCARMLGDLRNGTLPQPA